MAGAELDRLEREVQQARQRLKNDLEVLRAPSTFPDFKEAAVSEARQYGEDTIAKIKSGATSWSEHFIAELKERAVSNPVAVAAIAAGIGWHILRKPPVTTLLVGYGVYSLINTQAGRLAPGAATVYDATDAAIAAKEKIEQWSQDVGETVSHARDVLVPRLTDTITRLTESASDTIAGASGKIHAVASGGYQSAQKLNAVVGENAGEAVNTLKTMASQRVQNIRSIVPDEPERAQALLAAAAIALTTAIGCAWFRRHR
ncbi:MAG: hypothetical protein JO001_12605 [Alphaproteobacteria bacterium]|nr:hypothetical protein [Alphaproteobacteria bacterium]